MGIMEDSPARSPRSRILSSASSVFASRGFNGGSLTDIAGGADMTRPGVLHHYPSKQAVLLALLEERDQDLQILLPDTQQQTLRDILSGLDEVFEAILAKRELVQLAHVLTAEAASAGHPARPWVVRRHALLRQSLTKAIKNSQQRGELAVPVDAGALAAAILGAVEGIENQWLVSPDDFDARAALRSFTEVLAGGLLKPLQNLPTN
jgi:AcrR family transcriptional regulator